MPLDDNVAFSIESEDKKMNIKSFIKKFIPFSILERRHNQFIRKEIKREKTALQNGRQEEYLKAWYKQHTGEELDLENPITYTQKQQWMKLHCVTKEKVLCSDKWKVREYIKEKIGEEYLIQAIPNKGKYVFKNAFEIDFDELPESFVIQCNHGSGWTFPVKSKTSLKRGGFRHLCIKLNNALKLEYAYINGYEMVYEGIEPCIFLTEYLESNAHGLNDYKFMCFNGKAQYVWTDSDRFVEHKRNVHNLDYSIAPFSMARYDGFEEDEKPKNYDKMLELVGLLCKDFKDYVRVDFYNVNGKIYFGELTFSSGSGIEFPKPREYNKILGEKLSLE